jgi:hypothetical protein
MANRKPLVLVAGELQAIQSGDVPTDGDDLPIVPNGGSTGDVLTKASATNRDTVWSAPTTGVSLAKVFAISSLRI